MRGDKGDTVESFNSRARKGRDIRRGDKGGTYGRFNSRARKGRDDRVLTEAVA